MKRISALLILFALCLCAPAKDIKLGKADNDQIITAHVGDVLVVKFVPLAQVTMDSGSGLCLDSHMPLRGQYRVLVEKPGKADVHLKRCYGNHCVERVYHVDAKEKPKK